MQVTTNWEETGIKKGQRSLLIRQLTRKFGTINDRALAQVKALSVAKLESLGDALLDFGSIDDLDNWLTGQS